MNQLIGEIKRLERSWAEVDTQLSNALRSIDTSMSGPGLLKDLGFQIAQRIPDLQRRLDLIVATQKIGLDKGVVWADETLWASNSPASGAAAAKSVADQLRRAKKDAAFVGGQDALTRETLELLEKHKHDPYFAVAFAKEMPPKELRALLRDLYSSDRDSRRSLHKDWKEPPSSDVDRLVAALSVTLGTASRGVGDMKLPKGYADELIASDGEPLSDHVVNRLLQYGTFDDAFLLDIANKVFDNERKPRGEQQEMIGFGPGLAAALANNPRVAQDFFADPTRKPLAFLMREKYWGSGEHELGRAIEAATTRFRDNGQPPGSSRGYKSALIASWAIHFWADPRAQFALPDTRQSAARVFAAYIGDVNRISPRNPDYLGVNPLPDPDSILPGKQPYGAVFGHDESKRAMIWAFKDPEALKTVIAAHGKYSVMALDAQAAQVAQANKDAFNAWRKSHPNATQAEIDAQQQKILRGNMAGHTAEEFKARVFGLSKSLHFIVDAGNQSEINVADARDKTNKTMRDVAASTVKLMLTPTGEWVVAGYEFLEDNFGDQIKTDEGTKAREKAATALETSETMFRDLTADAMMRHGLFGDGTAAATTHPHTSENYAKGSERDFLRDGEILPRSAMTTKQRLAYEDWLEQGPASGMFKEVNDAVGDGFHPRPPDVPPKADE
ncbi:hypothetical protein [Nonomuraea basaltis]|uniref:hypothetical protein n=1 Tax=Nonomuraea basaltis TaxID=2495887 RepID=UPI00110C65A0|nr:hypothetical protein [Nonomuraea basaltis]TMR93040.1 hypothetical protein EJK15_41485 [Nonomuraea basaltis]